MTRGALRRKDFFKLRERVARELDSAQEINRVVNSFKGMNANGGRIGGVKSESNVETAGLIVLRDQDKRVTLLAYSPGRQYTSAGQAQLEILGGSQAVITVDLQPSSGNGSHGHAHAGGERGLNELVHGIDG
jgi:hypothetical protein